jgi:hypothetical protein
MRRVCSSALRSWLMPYEFLLGTQATLQARFAVVAAAADDGFAFGG